MSLEALERALASDVPPLLALVGSESTLIAEAVALVRAKVLVTAADFNRDELRVSETTIERVIEAAGTMPMMAPRRFVHLSDLHKLPAKDHPPLIAYIERPAPTAVLVLTGDKLDGRTKLGQSLTKARAVYTFEPPRQHELAGFIGARARRRGIKIEPDAVRLLADLVGTDVGSVDRALEKVMLHAGGSGAVTSDDVEELVAPTRVHSIFELTDAIGAKDLGKASLLLRNVLGGGESGVLVLSMITRQFRQLLQVKSALKSGAVPRELAQRIGLKPFLVDQLVAQARRYEQRELLGALDAALAADVRLKSTRLDPGVVLDRLLVEVAQAARA